MLLPGFLASCFFVDGIIFAGIPNFTKALQTPAQRPFAAWVCSHEAGAPARAEHQYLK